MRPLNLENTKSPLDVLRQAFGLDAFRYPQDEIIQRTLSGEHSLVVMPTGGGKSLCFQIPGLLLTGATADQQGAQNTKRPLTLVLSPLISLMKDQVDRLKSLGIDAEFINSTLNSNERHSRYKSLQDGRYQLLYVTPERFRKDEFRTAIATRDICLLAVDEAHCISEWGHDFRPDYSRLEELRRFMGNPTTIALTATATPEVQVDIVRQLGLKPDDVRIFHQGIDRPNLRISVEEVWGDEEKVERIDAITQAFQNSAGSGIVYFTLIKTLEQFSELLKREGLRHSCYHGNLEPVGRRRIQEEFMRGRRRLVLATPAFGMGIDKEDIRFVIHAEIPGSVESWYQEIGRAGRDGLPSECVLLYEEADLMTQMEFIRWSNPDTEFYERLYHLLTHNAEQVNAFGLEWLREKLHARQKHDRRLETAMAMLQRYDVINDVGFETDWEPLSLRVTGPLPSELLDQSALAEKLLRDQSKLYSIVQMVRHEGDRKQFIRDYFGIPQRTSESQ